MPPCWRRGLMCTLRRLFSLRHSRLLNSVQTNGHPGAYWVPSSQGVKLVMETLCPRHLRVPASHSVIVRTSPFTSTQMLIPSSLHSIASLQTHLLPWAGKISKRGLMAHRGDGNVKAHYLQSHDVVIGVLSKLLPSVMESLPSGKGCRTRKVRYFAPLKISRFPG